TCTSYDSHSSTCDWHTSSTRSSVYRDRVYVSLSTLLYVFGFSFFIVFYLFISFVVCFFFFFFQAEDGIRDATVTGVQTCALPISSWARPLRAAGRSRRGRAHEARIAPCGRRAARRRAHARARGQRQIGRASCRERV